MRFIGPKSNRQTHIDVRQSIVIVSLTILALVKTSYGYSQENIDYDLLDIRNSQFEGSYETLLVGEAEMPIIVKESTTPISRGLAILYTDYGSNPLSESGLGQLARYLNDVGWVTIAVQAPNEGFLGQASSDVQTVHAKQGLTVIEQQAFARHEAILTQQMQSLQTRALAYPGFFLVIAQGTTAAWLTKIFAEKQIELPDALVAVSANWPEYQYNHALAAWIAQTEMPYLDIYTNADNDWAASTVSDRKVQAGKSLKVMYRQRKLLGQSIGNVQHGLLAKEIYGWLTYMGW